MFKKWNPCGIGYDTRCNKMSLTFYNNGYTYYAFDVSEDEFDKFYHSGKWESYKLPRLIRQQVQKCEHDLEFYWNEDGKIARTYCKKCNYTGHVDNRTEEDMKLMWAIANKNTDKNDVIQAKNEYERLLQSYKDKYNESPFDNDIS